jgi:hypothetical protein
MDDIFSTEIIGECEIPKMTKDEFIQKTQAMLKRIMDEYGKYWSDAPVDDEAEDCSRCHGFLYIEQGGEGNVDCPNCKGTGKNLDRIFDADGFLEFMEHTIMFGSEPFIEVMECEFTPSYTTPAKDSL